jgi:DNA-binding transcriptional MerR regulator
MLTISQLATYAGVTVRAVRHYHQIGLLPEPSRDHSGYRSYDAHAVVRLIRIRTLAEAGVPLARVQELLEADACDFGEAIAELDKELRAEIRRLQQNRSRIARLAAGESLALPTSVVDYLNALRDLGVEERYIELERDAWIMVAARAPQRIDELIAEKQASLDDPDVASFYRLVSQALDWSVDDPRIIELADALEKMMERGLEEGMGEIPDEFDDPFVDLLDNTTANSSPIAQRLLAILEERGWRGWTRVERVAP